MPSPPPRWPSSAAAALIVSCMLPARAWAFDPVGHNVIEAQAYQSPTRRRARAPRRRRRGRARRRPRRVAHRRRRARAARVLRRVVARVVVPRGPRARAHALVAAAAIGPHGLRPRPTFRRGGAVSPLPRAPRRRRRAARRRPRDGRARGARRAAVPPLHTADRHARRGRRGRGRGRRARHRQQRLRAAARARRRALRGPRRAGRARRHPVDARVERAAVDRPRRRAGCATASTTRATRSTCAPAPPRVPRCDLDRTHPYAVAPSCLSPAAASAVDALVDARARLPHAPPRARRDRAATSPRR